LLIVFFLCTKSGSIEKTAKENTRLVFFARFAIVFSSRKFTPTKKEAVELCFLLFGYYIPNFVWSWAAAPISEVSFVYYKTFSMESKIKADWKKTNRIRKK
jgi:RsiW-degrading membrane proteinase PrsW (M82 family)